MTCNKHWDGGGGGDWGSTQRKLHSWRERARGPVNAKELYPGWRHRTPPDATISSSRARTGSGSQTLALAYTFIIVVYVILSGLNPWDRSRTCNEVASGRSMG